MTTAQNTHTETPDEASNIFSFWQEPADIAKNSKSYIWVESNNFYRANEKIRKRKGEPKSSSPFLIIGFDTEYKTPSNPLQRWELEEGYGRNKILSYQVFCKLFLYNTLNTFDLSQLTL